MGLLLHPWHLQHQEYRNEPREKVVDLLSVNCFSLRKSLISQPWFGVLGRTPTPLPLRFASKTHLFFVTFGSEDSRTAPPKSNWFSDPVSSVFVSIRFMLSWCYPAASYVPGILIFLIGSVRIYATSNPIPSDGLFTIRRPTLTMS